MTSCQEKTPSAAFFVTRLIAYQPLQYVVVAFCWILFNIWPLVSGLLAKAFFDVLEDKSLTGLTLQSVIALVIAAGFARVGITYIATLSSVSWHFKLWSLLRYNLFTRILRRPDVRTLPSSIGEVISTMRDDVQAMGIVCDWGFDAIAALIFAVGGLAILLWVNVRVTLLVFIPIVIIVVLAQAARTRLEDVREQSREATAQVTGSIGEIFSAAQAIQIAGAEDRVVAHLGRLGEERQRAVLRDRLAGLSLDAIFASTASLGAGLTLLVAAIMMQTGEFSVGDFALFATYLLQVAEYTSFLAYLVNMYQQSGVAFRRGVALLQGASAQALVAHRPLHLKGPLPIPEPVTEATRSLGPDVYGRLNTLEVAGLTFYHAGSRGGIENVSFQVERGTFTVITGRIASGKTTLLQAMLGLLEPQAGQVRWNGQEISDPASFLVPPRVAYKPQVPTLLSGTLRENILLGLPNNEEALAEAIHCAVLERDLEMFPDGTKTLIGAKGVRLSGGQIQRAAAARMFVREPEILVIDDLSSALDVETESALWQRVLKRDVTCLAVSHHRTVLEKADQILVLESGRISARGKLEALLEASTTMRQLYFGEQP